MMKYFPKLNGERLYLSPMNAGDAACYTKWLNDLTVTDGLGTSSLVQTVEAEEKWIEENAGQLQFAIVRKTDDQLIGNCGIQEHSPIHQCAEVGLFLGEESDRSQGLGAEALHLLLGYGFNLLNLHSIMLKVFSFNERAIRCYQKVGFKEIGRRRQCYYLNGRFHDQILMDILREEWNQPDFYN